MSPLLSRIYSKPWFVCRWCRKFVRISVGKSNEEMKLTFFRLMCFEVIDLVKRHG